jgi:hypothetical protein
MLRRIFGPKREEVAGGCRRLHNGELHKLYASLDVIRVIKEDEMGGSHSTHGGNEKYVQVFGWKI